MYTFTRASGSGAPQGCALGPLSFTPTVKPLKIQRDTPLTPAESAGSLSAVGVHINTTNTSGTFTTRTNRTSAQSQTAAVLFTSGICARCG